MARLQAAHVLLVGVGGVGSWCAEALIRTGLGAITLVDDDIVAVSNLNRQCPATSETLGQAKVEAMRARLTAVNPEVSVTIVPARYPLSPGVLDITRFDSIVDAIDSVSDKAQLILDATAADIPLVSSMGAALRFDPTRVTVSRFEKVSGDGLARALRRQFKRLGRFPARRFDCVWSSEQSASCTDRGSLMPVTCAFGMAMASAVLARLSRISR